MKKKPFLNAKLLAVLAIFGITLILCLFPKMTQAQASNIFVEDYAQILSNQDENDIKNMNEQIFSNLPGSPQYVVVTLKNLDGYDSIEDYAEKKFQQLGIGDKELDNGFLFVISIENQRYRLETGYGVEDVITDSMKRDVVTEDIDELLDDEQYEQAVMEISKNIQTLVTEKYSDMDAAKEVIKKEKERNAILIRLLLFVVIGVVLLVILFIFYYLMKIKRIQKIIRKKYVSENVMAFIYINKKTTPFGLSRGIAQVNLSNYLAKIIVQKPKFKNILQTEEAKEWIAQYLLVDSVIMGWRNSKELKKYDISIYIEKKQLDAYKENHSQEYKSFSYPVSNNPYLSESLFFEINQYLKSTFSKHTEAMRISKENKRYVERVCELFLSQRKIRLKKLDYQLELALMVYYFLQEQDLSDPKLLRKIQIDNQTLLKSYQFADKKRKKIAYEKRRKALDDLTSMTLANYYLEAMIWSSYNNSQSSSFGGRGGGGGSSFGGGSSGGGGFSGGW